MHACLHPTFLRTSPSFAGATTTLTATKVSARSTWPRLSRRRRTVIARRRLRRCKLVTPRSCSTCASARAAMRTRRRRAGHARARRCKPRGQSALRTRACAHSSARAHA
eukprot:6188612-Pleurochrysis_carterae.AAC.3